MYLDWVDTLSLVKAEFLDGTVLEFPCNTWSRARITNKVAYHDDVDEMVSPDIFICINNYLATLPKEKSDRIEQLYIEIYNILIINTDILEINRLVHAALSELMELIDWEPFKQWCLAYGELNLMVGIKDEMGDNDTKETTYFTRDYENLVVFSVLLKLILPIWGMYFKLVKEFVGDDYAMIYAVDLIRNHYTDINPAFQKLEAYVNTVAQDKIKVTGFSVTSDIGSEEIPNYLLALTLWKKVCIFDAKAHDKSVIRDVFSILKDKCRRINNGGPNQKKIINEQGDDISIVETYKIVQRIPPAVEVSVSHYIKSDYFVTEVEPRLNVADVENIRRELPLDKQVLEFYIPILAAVCGKHIGNRNLHLVRKEILLNVIAVSSAALKDWGFPVLSQLLVTVPGVRDIYSINYLSNKAQLPLTEENAARLSEIYQFTGSYNPGLKLIETIVKEVNTYTFDIKEGLIENLTNEIAELIIRTSKPTKTEIIYHAPSN